MPLRGAYCLSINVDGRIVVKIGSLGNLTFEPGRYVYVGSAMNGIESRVNRHLNTSRKHIGAIHWHIDYLLKERGVHIEAVHAYASHERLECKIAESISEKFEPVPGFGCSDCKCRSHLFRVEEHWDPMELGFPAAISSNDDAT